MGEDMKAIPRKTVDLPGAEREDCQQLLLECLLDMIPGPYAMLYAYLDESGTHGDSPALCVTGLLYNRAGMKRLDRAWKKELEAASLPYFHTVEYAHLQGEFRGRDRASADDLYKRLIALIKKHTLASITVFYLPWGDYAVLRDGKAGYSPYTICSFCCMNLLISAAVKLKHEKVAFFIESGHANMGELNTLVRAERRSGWIAVQNCDFQDKEGGVRPLQAADVLAYEMGKRLKDMAANPSEPPERRLRKSLKEIISEDGRHGTAMLTRALLGEFYHSLRSDGARH